jgi:hypothetical protein
MMRPSFWILTLVLSLGFVLPQAEAAIAFRSKSFTWSASSVSSVTPSEPAGSTQGDILIMFVLLNNNVNISMSSEWSEITPQFLAPNSVRIGLFWTRRGTSAPNYTATLSSASSYNEASVTAWSGVLASGSPFGTAVTNSQTRNPANPDCPSITVAVANSVVLAFGMTWSGWTSVAGIPAPYTIAEGGISGTNNDLGVAYYVKSTTGAENPPAFTNGVGGLDTVVEITVEMKAAAATKVHHRVFSL